MILKRTFLVHIWPLLIIETSVIHALLFELLQYICCHLQNVYFCSMILSWTFSCVETICNNTLVVIIWQALVHLLRTEGVQLGDKPIPPEDTIKLRPKRYGDQLVNFDGIPEWVSYW